MTIKIFDIIEDEDCFSIFLDSHSLFKNTEVREEFKVNIEKFYDNFSAKNVLKTLLIGRIQSGKTLFYTGIISKYFSTRNGLCIVLSGTKRTLQSQTFERLRNDLSPCNIPVFSNISSLNTSFNKKNILVVLKNPSGIKSVLKYLQLNNIENLLIVDDESDQASLNLKNYSNIINGSDDSTPTYEALINLIYWNDSAVKYLQITATPQAHVLTGEVDILKSNLVTSIPLHSNYFGNELLFRNKDKLIRLVNGTENHSEFHSFFLTYFKSCVELILDGNVTKNISCFVHCSHLQESNDEIYEALDETVKLLETVIFSRNSDLSYLPINAKNALYYIREHSIIIQEIMSQFKIQRVYGKYDKKINWEQYFQENKYFCLIGGNKLERGFTINGLITTYFTRNSLTTSNADTFEQRCRFFGNRADLIKYITIFCTDEILRKLYEYYENEKKIFRILLSYNNFVNEIHDLLPAVDFILSNPTRKPVISLPAYFSKPYSWSYLYFNGDSYDDCMDVFVPLLKTGSVHPDSGGSDMNTHQSFSIGKKLLIELLENKKIIPKSKDKFKIDILKSFIGKHERFTVIALSNLLLRERTFDNYDGTLKVPNAVHSSTNTGGYIGDSNIISKDSELSIQIGNYADREFKQKIFIMAYKLTSYDN
jgi:hypothetical protein